jgi:membrane-bound ClpP family serine protease
MLLYFSLGLIGFLLLIISFIFGELDDLLSIDIFSDHDGVGPFNSKVMAAALTAFGAAGMLTTYYGWGALPSALASAAVALGVGAAGWWMLSLIYNQESSTDFVVSRLKGQLGEVTTTIPADGLGQVLCSGVAGSRQMLARTVDGTVIPVGQTVRIVETIGSTLIVEAVRQSSSSRTSATEPTVESTA